MVSFLFKIYDGCDTNDLLNSFKLFPLAKKLFFQAHILSFLTSVAMLCSLKKPSSGFKIPDFRINAKSLNEFIIFYIELEKSSSSIFLNFIENS